MQFQYKQDDLEYADTMAAVLKEQFKIDVNNGPFDKVLKHLNQLPDILKNGISKAKAENPERCKRELVQIRLEALHWYLLDHINNDRCNVKLFSLKPELKWFIEETKRVHDSVNIIAKDAGQIVEKPDDGKLEIRPKPQFRKEIVSQVFDLLKGFFYTEEQAHLKEILNTGNDLNKPLLFMDNGKRLADVFKKLKEHDFIAGCDKKGLQNWVARNFRYTFRGEAKDYTPSYIEICISRNDLPCKNPILKIENGVILSK